MRLVTPWFDPLLQAVGISGAWRAVGGPPVGSPVFGTAFHLWVGLLMALAYAYALEPILPGRPLAKGLLHALAVWLLHAFVVLPATGEGIAGSAHLTLAGMVWFAVAHTLFFVALALLYARLRCVRAAASFRGGRVGVIQRKAARPPGPASRAT